MFMGRNVVLILLLGRFVVIVMYLYIPSRRPCFLRGFSQVLARFGIGR